MELFFIIYFTIPFMMLLVLFAFEQDRFDIVFGGTKILEAGIILTVFAIFWPIILIYLIILKYRGVK